MASDEIPGFELDDDLEELLTSPLDELDEDTLLSLQTYKSQKLKAKRDAGVSTDRPEWWSSDAAPETVAELSGQAAETADEEVEPEPEDAEQSPEEETEPAETEATGPEPSDAEEGLEETGAKKSQSGPSTEKRDKPEEPAEKPRRIPQVGWSSGKGQDLEIDHSEVEVSLEAAEEGEAEAGEPEAQPESEVAEESETEEPTREETGDKETTEPAEPAPSGEDQPRHAGKFLIHTGPPADEIPGFDADDELEELLDQDIMTFDEEKRQDIQLYRAQKIKAMRDAGIAPTEVAEQAEAEPAPEPGGEPEASESRDEAEAEEAAETGPEASDEAQEPEEEETAEEEPAAPAPSGDDSNRHAGRFRIHVGPDPADLPGFDPDEELEELLDQDIMGFEEEKRQKIQLYRARKIKAMRDAGISPDDSTSIGGGPEVLEAGETAESSSAGEPEEVEDEAEAEASSTEQTEGDSTEEAEPAEQDEEAEEETAEEEEEPEPQLSREELPDDPGVDELIQAGLIDQEVEQDDSEGIFFTTVDRKKAYIAYSRSQNFLTLYYYQIPTNVTDEEWEAWIKDLLGDTVFEFARENDLKVIPQASDVTNEYLVRHPENLELLKETSRREFLEKQQRMAVSNA